MYSLTDQIRRSSRAVAAMTGEGYGKRKYPAHFSMKMTDAAGECYETMVWLNYAKDCGYLERSIFEELIVGYREVSRLLGYYIQHPEKFATSYSHK